MNLYAWHDGFSKCSIKFGLDAPIISSSKTTDQFQNLIADFKKNGYKITLCNDANLD